MQTTPEIYLSKFVLLPQLKLLSSSPWSGLLTCESLGLPQHCPRCSEISSTGYDRRKVRCKDVPLNGEMDSKPITLWILKRRFWCKPCQKPFLEKIPGILPRQRTTERFKRLVMWACDRFASLSQVCEDYEVSSDFVYRAFYAQLELKRKKDNQYPWPEAIGIDEHGVGRDKTRVGGRAYVTMIVNHKHKKLMDVVFGKKGDDLIARLSHIPGRENVRYVTLDMSDSYRGFIKNFFPNAQLIADKFHVIRLLSHVILKERKRIAGNNANRKARSLLLCSAVKLDWEDAIAIRQYLKKYPRLEELYAFKERIHGFYRCKGYDRAKLALQNITFDAALSNEPEIRRLGKTLQYWSTEILNYFAFGLTNARVEGFNNKASLVRRRAFGYRNLANYRLRLLSVCS